MKLIRVNYCDTCNMQHGGVLAPCGVEWIEAISCKHGLIGNAIGYPDYTTVEP